MVSIIPGMDIGAPDLTETRRGFSPPPKVFPVDFSSLRMASTTSGHMESSHLEPSLWYSRHPSVVIIKPGGTGRPIRHISAKLAPLPPKRSRILALPSLNS